MHARTYIFDIVGVHLTMFCNVLLLSFALSFAVMVRFFHLLFWILNLIYVSPFSIMCMHTRAPQNICGCNGAEYLVGWLVHRMDVSYATLQFLLGATPSNWCYFIPLYVQPIYLPCTFHMRWMGQMGGWNVSVSKRGDHIWKIISRKPLVSGVISSAWYHVVCAQHTKDECFSTRMLGASYMDVYALVMAIIVCTPYTHNAHIYALLTATVLGKIRYAQCSASCFSTHFFVFCHT